MKILYSVFTFLILFWLPTQTNILDLETIRKNYSQAVTNKALCKAMINELSTINKKDEYLGYLGAFQAIWANHTINPINKLSTFNKGKKNIEKAIKNKPNSVELRFVRLSIQKNVPRILGYNENIAEDETFVRNYLSSIQSNILKKMCQDIL